MATTLRADATAPLPDDEPAHLADYRPVALHRQRHDGWIAKRQRTSIV